MWNVGDEWLCMSFHAGTFQGNSDLLMSSALAWQLFRSSVDEPRAAPSGALPSECTPGGDPRGICCAPPLWHSRSPSFQYRSAHAGTRRDKDLFVINRKDCDLPRHWLRVRDIVRHSSEAAVRPSAGLAVPVLKMSRRDRAVKRPVLCTRAAQPGLQMDLHELLH